MLALIAAALALAPAPALVGLYRSSQNEVGAALELSADGSFRYQLEYGAVSESGRGRWSSDGRGVRLTSDPMPAAPAFVVVGDEALPKGKLAVAVVEPRSPYFDSLDVTVAVDGGAPLPLRIGRDETVDLPDGRSALMVPLVPVYGVPAARITLGLDRGHRLSLRFDPRDLGMARFAGEPLAMDDGTLLLERYGATIRLRRTDPDRE